MKKTVFLLALCSIILAGCSDNYNTTGQDEAGAQVISITATMPEKAEPAGSGTRALLEQDALDIQLIWEVDDEIQFFFVYGDNKKARVVTEVSSVSADGKSAFFSLTLPDDISYPFDLYGVYGGGGLSTVPGEEHLAVLPTHANSVAKSLEELGTNNGVMLSFEKKGIGEETAISGTFTHIGSIFKIQLANIGTTNLNDVKKLEFTSSSPIGAHINQEGSGTYDITTKTFSGTVTTATALSFELAAATTINAGTSLDFVSWFPVTESDWPEMVIDIYDSTNSKINTSSANVHTRTSPPVNGAAYYFYTTYEEGELSLTTAAGTFTDNRDGTVYKTIRIGAQEWMAENLKYIPEDGAGFNGNNSNKDPRYAVYGYTGSDVSEAKTTDNFATYGVLYNWPAALDRSIPADEEPDKEGPVQGVCPEGWHLPSFAEWIQLVTFMGDKPASKLKSAGPEWSSSPGIVSTNESRFSALPGGWKNRDNYEGIGEFGRWWSSTRLSKNNAHFITLRYDDNNTYFTGGGDTQDWYRQSKSRGNSVRCVRNQ